MAGDAAAVICEVLKGRGKMAACPNSSAFGSEHA